MSGIAVGVAAVGLTTATISFVQANKQKKAVEKADRAAAVSMDAAKKKLSVNYMDSLGINKEAYEIEANANLVSGAQALDAGASGERGAEATAGRIVMAQSEVQRKTAVRMGGELDSLDAISAKEDASIAKAQAQIDLAEAEGAQIAAGQANELRKEYIESGIRSAGDVAVAGIEGSDLYGLESSEKRDATADQRAAEKAAKKAGKLQKKRNRRLKRNPSYNDVGDGSSYDELYDSMG